MRSYTVGLDPLFYLLNRFDSIWQVHSDISRGPRTLRDAISAGPGDRYIDPTQFAELLDNPGFRGNRRLNEAQSNFSPISFMLTQSE